MTPPQISQLLRRTLVVVAHPDDESIGAGALLQRMEDPIVVFCTDGGPRDSYFWKAYGSREHYAEIRREEARHAAAAIGLKRHTHFPIVDQELYRNLDSAYEELGKLVRDLHPDAILTLAYEGGHPDHDCCAFLSHSLALRHQLPVWEMPIYHRSGDGPHQQQFVHPSDDIRQIHITASELERKRKMVTAYSSQTGLLETFDLELERFRPQAKYDFLHPPADRINYEFWEWPITATQLCAAFATFPHQADQAQP